MARQRVRSWVWATAMFVGISAAAEGQVPTRVEIVPQVGYFNFSQNTGDALFVNEDALAYQLRVGLTFPGNWGFEASGGLIPSEFNDGTSIRNTRSFYLSGVGTYRLVNSSGFTPIFLAGAEVLDLDATNGEAEANPAFVVGGALERAVARNVSIRADARAHRGVITQKCKRGRPQPAGRPRCRFKPRGSQAAFLQVDDVLADGEVEGTPENDWLNHFEFSFGLAWTPWE